MPHYFPKNDLQDRRGALIFFPIPMENNESDIQSDLPAWRDKVKKAIEEDGRIELAARARIRTNRVLLNYIQASLDGYQPMRISTVDGNPKKPRRLKNEGRRKRDFVMRAIESLGKNFVADDVYKAVHELFPGCGITRKHVSSLMWKLSTTEEGKRAFRQTVPWTGGKEQAQYEKLVFARNRQRPSNGIAGGALVQKTLLEGDAETSEDERT
jgi:hypothetical protein